MKSTRRGPVRLGRRSNVAAKIQLALAVLTCFTLFLIMRIYSPIMFGTRSGARYNEVDIRLEALEKIVKERRASESKGIENAKLRNTVVDLERTTRLKGTREDIVSRKNTVVDLERTTRKGMREDTVSRKNKICSVGDKVILHKEREHYGWMGIVIGFGKQRDSFDVEFGGIEFA